MTYSEMRQLMASPQALAQIHQQTEFLTPHYASITLRQRLWHVEHGNFEVPRCDACKQQVVNWSTKNLRYSRFCSSQCAQRHTSVREKKQQTCLARFGVTTNLQHPENQKKSQATNLKKYGFANAAQSAEVISKIRQSHRDHWGVDNASQHPDVKQRITQTHQARYQRDRHSQRHISQEVLDLKNNAQLMRHWFCDLQMPVTEIAETLGVNHSQLCVHFKNNLGIDISRHGVSTVERQIREFVSARVPCEFNNRSLIAPRELDIVIPQHRLAIEVDGLAWHTELRGKHPSYHWEKHQQCRRLGWRLMNILDLEWQQKPQLTQSRIQSALGLNARIGARTCDLVELSAREASDFLRENHTQGDCASSVRLGLTQAQGLVAVLTLGASRFDRNQQWELLRYASVMGVNVQGGASRLWRRFLQQYQPATVISYCDTRLNTGGLYQQLGFHWQRDTGPNYWYTRRYQTFENRMRYQKHKLASMLETFDPRLTEWENMQAQGWDRYWDSGSSVWLWSASC